MLCHLVRNAGRLVSKDDIIAAVWPTANVSDASLAQCISEVRLALRDQNQQLIRTVVGRGYRFVAMVTSASPDASAAAVPWPGADAASDATDPVAHEATEHRHASSPSTHPLGPTTLFGRDEELEWMLRRWREAESGYGQVLLLSGEAGIGKSRLVAEFLARAAPEPRQCLRYACFAGRSDSAFYPPLGEIEAAAQIAVDDAMPTRSTKLEAFLRELPLAASDRSMLASLLSPAADAPEANTDTSPSERRQRMLDALLHRVEAQSQIAPAIVIIEDIQWIDPSSLELLERLVDRAPEIRLLVVLTFRPEFSPRWVGQHHVSMLALKRLSPQDGRQLISRLSGANRIAEDLTEVILDRSEGVPLFIEELTRAAYDRRITLARDLPSSLQASLADMLDRLGPARRIAQLAAAIGRAFPVTLLAAVADLTVADLMPRLEQLMLSGLIQPQRPRTSTAFVFRHALFRDAAYATIPERERHDLHIRLAEAMQQPDLPALRTAPEVIASHFAAGGQPLRAFHWWRRAGEDALRNAAFEETFAHFGKAIAIADGPGADSSSPLVTGPKRLALQVAYSQAVLWARGIEQAIEAFARARELAALIGDTSVRFASYYGLWAGNMLNARLHEASAVAEAFLRDANDVGAVAETGVAHRALGTACWFTGRFQQARTHLMRALDIYDPERDRGVATRLSIVPGPPARICLALTCFVLGHSDEAARLAAAAIAEADQIGHVPTQTYVLTEALLLDLIGGEAGPADALASRLLQLSSAHALPHIAYARILDLATRFRLGGLADAPHRMRVAIEDLCKAGRRLGLPCFLAILAEMEIAAGEPTIALTTADWAAAEAERSGERWYASPIQHLRGRLLLTQGRIAEARTAFATAMTIADDQQAAGFAQRMGPTTATLDSPPDGQLS
ncbi:MULTISPECIES: AAA family ATPase [unclassified Bradyrhizobium]|uniref:AAA family ATPase n=1 Tax=unclassified Bradyrhizobium TaxID=2631580 RepID=UPI0024E07BC2|nr:MULTISPECIES: AAA family ATPase [unclassified Bradyrhizobium]